MPVRLPASPFPRRLCPLCPICPILSPMPEITSRLWTALAENLKLHRQVATYAH